MWQVFLSFVLVSCLDQYDPRPHWRKFEQERKIAHRLYPSLAEDGTLPQAEQKLDPAELAEKNYASYCSNCHGAEGRGDGAGGVALSPLPRNFRDPLWQEQTTDDRIHKAIKEGGAAVGLKNTMAPFGAILNLEEITAMVVKIRKFGKSD